MPRWIIAPEWKGEAVFVIGGGPSVLEQDLNKLRGRRVIVVNSSYEAAPWADMLFFADSRWFNVHSKRPAFNEFKGRKVTCNASIEHPQILKLKRIMPNTDPKHGELGPGMADKPHSVVANRTSLQGAMNVAVHLGAERIVLLGADMQRAEDGRSHHHTPHQWKNKPGNATWDAQMEQLKLAATSLRARGIQVLNASARTRIDFWPRVTLEQVLLAK